MIKSKAIYLCLLGLALVLGVETYTNLDLWVQNQFYVPEKHEWLINPTRHKELTLYFYDGLKRFLIIFAAACLINMLLSIKLKNLRKYNHFCLIMLLSFIFIPTIIAGAKAFTNVYCPYQLDIYNGLYPFVRIFEHYPTDFIQPKVGRCFPAGHSTAGFAFLGLFYAFKNITYRWLGLTTGLILGWTAGIYQLMRGQHFLSHTLFSMIAAFLLLIIINKIAIKIENKFPHMISAT